MAFDLEAYKEKYPDRWAGHMETARARSGLPAPPEASAPPASTGNGLMPTMGETPRNTFTGGPYGRGYNAGGAPRGGPGMSRAEIDEMWDNVERGVGVINGRPVVGFYGPGSNPTYTDVGFGQEGKIGPGNGLMPSATPMPNPVASTPYVDVGAPAPEPMMPDPGMQQDMGFLENIPEPFRQFYADLLMSNRMNRRG